MKCRNFMAFDKSINKTSNKKRQKKLLWIMDLDQWDLIALIIFSPAFTITISFAAISHFDEYHVQPKKETIQVFSKNWLYSHQKLHTHTHTMKTAKEMNGNWFHRCEWILKRKKKCFVFVYFFNKKMKQIKLPGFVFISFPHLVNRGEER